MDKIENCPFCGSAAGVVSHYGVDFWVQCNSAECGSTNGKTTTNRAFAISTWNKRAALAARATPAQPVQQVWRDDEGVHFSASGACTGDQIEIVNTVCQGIGMQGYFDALAGVWRADGGCQEIPILRAIVAAYQLGKCTANANTQPSPSSVGDAIHYPECWDVAAYPTLENALSELYAFFKCSNDECAKRPVNSVGDAIRAMPLPEADYKFGTKGMLCEDAWTADQVRELLSEAAALAEQMQGQQVPELVSIDDMCAILKDMLIEADEYTDSNIVYKVTFDQLRALYMKGMAATPSIAQDGQKPEAK